VFARLKWVVISDRNLEDSPDSAGMAGEIQSCAKSQVARVRSTPTRPIGSAFTESSADDRAARIRDDYDRALSSLCVSEPRRLRDVHRRSRPPTVGRRHEVRLLAWDWAAASLPESVICQRVAGPPRCTRSRRPWLFSAGCRRALAGFPRAVSIGFDKTLGLDILYPQGGLYHATAAHNRLVARLHSGAGEPRYGSGWTWLLVFPPAGTATTPPRTADARGQQSNGSWPCRAPVRAVARRLWSFRTPLIRHDFTRRIGRRFGNRFAPSGAFGRARSSACSRR